MPRVTRSIAARFIEKVSPEPNTGCWLWLGPYDAGGYGLLPGRPVRRASRVAWQIAHREAPPGHLYVCHRCDEPACVNPDHLFLGTPLVNVLDKIAKGRAVYLTLAGRLDNHSKRAKRREAARIAKVERTIERRFMRKVSPCPVTGCWWFVGAADPNGYGRFSVHGKAALAHRVSWEIARGPLAPALDLLHACDQPTCVNPDHLRPGTALENVRDMIARGRRPVRPEWAARGLRNGKHTHPEKRQRGEAHGRAKLTDAQVREIRSRYAPGRSFGRGAIQPNSAKALAREFGVDPSLIHLIGKRRIWTHLK